MVRQLLFRGQSSFMRQLHDFGSGVYIDIYIYSRNAEKEKEKTDYIIDMHTSFRLKA